MGCEGEARWTPVSVDCTTQGRRAAACAVAAQRDAGSEWSGSGSVRVGRRRVAVEYELFG